jgi:ABC-type branched-subunit amino acid transport system ATPase component
LLLLEEPFLQLNQEEKNNLLTFIRNRKATTIIIEKDINMSWYDVVYELNDGKLEKLK